ncbi:FtsW/RodA/SpoVE family cell cycle protein [Neobacillus muris]|uniref:FtsW/RodA/SpoVE family cell cycle protein n=1 Tax=Neobacillus muris TaxID=2941334 RepID=UPI00203EB0EE|nr:FtsW/RodA/SpoVE family cell cycle protein [Neobacillus muris]
MNKLSQSFLQEVLLNIKSKEAKELVRKELTYHLEQAKLEMLSKGISEEEAEEKAVHNMGNPNKLGHHFNKLYRPKMDWILLSLFLIAILMGLLPQLHVQDQYTGNFLLKQSIYILLGVVVALVVMVIDYRKTERLGWYFLALGSFILLALIFTPNVIINGERFIEFAGFAISGTTVLPILLMFWASYSSKKKANIVVIFSVYIVTVFMFTLLPSLTDAAIYSVFLLILFIFSGNKRMVIYSTVGISLGLLAAFTALLWFTAKDYQLVRIFAFLHPEDYADNAGYTYIKVRELITEGGWFGQQKPKYVPEIMTDLAFANITYYYGWLVAGFLLIVFVSLLTRMLIVSRQIRDRYGKQLMVAVCSLFSIQFLYNVGMVFGFLPIISISLPFISYGMTPTILNSLLIGIALGVYRRKNIVRIDV